jgi:hypothetical protein
MTTRAEAVAKIETMKAASSLPRLGGAAARGFLNSLTVNREFTAKMIAANNPMFASGDEADMWRECCAAIDAGEAAI